MPLLTSKQRSERIEFDYFRRADPIALARYWLSGAAVVGVLGWLLWSAPARTKALATHGVLQRRHAALDTECEACHAPFRPIDGSSWVARFVPDPHASDRRCNDCHARDAPDHRAGAVTHPGSCAGCHSDHRGRDVSLVSRSDQQCTRCHASAGELRRHSTATAALAGPVSGFDADPGHHPEFGLFRKKGPLADPGKVEFNHAQHMAPGMRTAPGGRPLLTLVQLAPAEREKYRAAGAGDGQPVQLRCESCHVPETPTGGLAVGAGRDLMRPIRYESHCRACHPLDYDPAMPPVEHRLQQDAVIETVRRSYALRYVQEPPELGVPPRRAHPTPGREDPPEIRAARETVEEQVGRARRVLLGAGKSRCGECHDLSGKIEAAVPEIWYRQARFSHEAHAARAIKCSDCHPRADAAGPKASTSRTDVLVPGIDVCRRCHTPGTPRPGPLALRAGSDCVECHRYHGGEVPGRGAGPLGRDDQAVDGLRRFLAGR
jgi:hypothetical protein